MKAITASRRGGSAEERLHALRLVAKAVASSRMLEKRSFPTRGGPESTTSVATARWSTRSGRSAATAASTDTQLSGAFQAEREQLLRDLSTLDAAARTNAQRARDAEATRDATAKQMRAMERANAALRAALDHARGDARVAREREAAALQRLARAERATATAAGADGHASSKAGDGAALVAAARRKDAHDVAARAARMVPRRVHPTWKPYIGLSSKVSTKDYSSNKGDEEFIDDRYFEDSA